MHIGFWGGGSVCLLFVFLFGCLVVCLFFCVCQKKSPKASPNVPEEKSEVGAQHRCFFISVLNDILCLLFKWDITE